MVEDPVPVYNLIYCLARFDFSKASGGQTPLVHIQNGSRTGDSKSMGLRVSSQQLREEIEGPHQATLTQEYLNGRDRTSKINKRVHARIVFKELGRSLLEYMDSVELVRVCTQAFIGEYSIGFLEHWLTHSIGNKQA